MPVYDDQRLDTDHDPSLDPASRQAEIDELERLFAAPSAPERATTPHSHSPQDLRDRERHSDDQLDDAATEEDDKLGRGYTDQRNGQRKKKPMSGRRKAGISIFGVGIGATVFAAIFTFIAMIPMRVEAMVRNFQEQYMAQVYDGLQEVSMNIFSDYITYVIMPNLNGTCQSTVDPSCTFVAPGTSPVDKFYQAWAKQRMERDLAQHGIVIGRRGGPTQTKTFYMNLNGGEIDITRLQNGSLSLFDLPGTQEVSRAEIRRAVNNAIEETTFWKTIYKRFMANRYLRTNFGIYWCDQHCSWFEGTHNRIDAVSASINDKKLAQKVWLMQRLAPEKYQIVVGCIMDVGQCVDTLDPATSEDDMRMSPAQRQLYSIVSQASLNLNERDLTRLAAAAREAGDIGVKEYMVREATKKLATTMLGAEAAERLAEQSTRAMTKSIPYIGWAIFAANVISFIDKAPDAWRYMSYTIQASTAVAVWTGYEVHASEIEAGQTDDVIAGAYDQSLTEDALDGGDFASDMMNSPLVATIMGVSSPTSSMGLFNTRVSAADPGTTSTYQKYKCDDGKPVDTKNMLVCPEERLAQNSTVLLASKVSLDLAYPGIGAVAGGVTKVVDYAIGLLPTEYLGKALVAMCDAPRLALSILLPPGAAMCYAAEAAGKLGQKVTTAAMNAMPNQYRPDGARMANMAAAGADVTSNRLVRDTLGGTVATPEEVTMIRNRYIAEQKAKLQESSLYARMFSKDTPYSLVSRLAVRLPSREPEDIMVAVAKSIAQPLDQVDSSIARVGEKQAFASDVMIAKAFGVTQYKAPAAPKHPGQYFKDNCLQRYDETTGQLDSSEFLNNQTTTDPITGEQMNTTENTCALVHAAFGALGGMSEGFKIPEDTSQSGGGGTNDTGDLFGDSTGTQCYNDPATPDEDTIDLGTQDGYHEGKKIPIRVCAISTIKSQAGESNPNDTYYIPKADGLAILNSKLSKAAYELGRDMTKAHGSTPVLISAFRSMPKQENLCAAHHGCRNGDFTFVAQPGHSNHQMGLALDFQEPSNRAKTSSCTGRATEPGSRVWSWLEANARRYGGLQQYAAEAWHWDPLGGSTRCGGGLPAGSTSTTGGTTQ